MGQPGPAPQQWDGAPTPPAYRFRNKKLTTFGRNGVDGADINEDPFGLAARARMIARTELGQARNAAADAALVELDADYKMWSSFDDGGTRRSHKHIDGAVVPASESFQWKSKAARQIQRENGASHGPWRVDAPPCRTDKLQMHDRLCYKKRVQGVAKKPSRKGDQTCQVCSH